MNTLFLCIQFFQKTKAFQHDFYKSLKWRHIPVFYATQMWGLSSSLFVFQSTLNVEQMPAEAVSVACLPLPLLLDISLSFNSLLHQLNVMPCSTAAPVKMLSVNLPPRLTWVCFWSSALVSDCRMTAKHETEGLLQLILSHIMILISNFVPGQGSTCDLSAFFSLCINETNWSSQSLWGLWKTWKSTIYWHVWRIKA